MWAARAWSEARWWPPRATTTSWQPITPRTHGRDPVWWHLGTPGILRAMLRWRRIQERTAPSGVRAAAAGGTRALQSLQSAAPNSRRNASRSDACIAARCNCLRRCTSPPMASKWVADGSAAPAPKRSSSTSRGSSLAATGSGRPPTSTSAFVPLRQRKPSHDQVGPHPRLQALSGR